MFQGIANLLFRLLGAKSGTDHGKRFFGNPGRLTNQRKFFLVLDLPQVLHHAGGGADLQLREFLGNLLPRVDGHRIGLDRQPRNARRTKNLDDLLMNQNAGPADVHLQPRAFLLDLGGIPPVADQNLILLSNKQIA